MNRYLASALVVACAATALPVVASTPQWNDGSGAGAGAGSGLGGLGHVGGG